MRLLLPSNVRRTMRQHLSRARRREIGGILMGEEIDDQVFRVVDFSVDEVRGTEAHFVRDSDHHDRELHEFFEKTGADYRRYNYLGEWHSHPRFDVRPSLQDIHSMQDLVDGSRGVDFAVLLISRLSWLRRFQCGALLFVQHGSPTEIEVLHEGRVKRREAKI